MSQFQFVMRSGPNPGKVYPLEGSDFTIGRDANNVVTINDAEISRKHAKMELRGSSYVIQDLGSTNGTFVNGNRITGMQVLNPNDIVSFGENIVLMYESVADPNATMLSSAKAPKTAARAQKPAPVPAPAPAPAPAYSGQVPVGPPPAAVAPAKKGNGKLILIIILVVVVCIILGCVAALLWIDADATGGRWCQYLPFVARWLGAVCP
jgi:predicted component of type VI protein secretion system